MAKYWDTDIENKIIQLRKGILELAVLGALFHSSHYGYSLARVLTSGEDAMLKEGTIYPILSRLAKDGLVSSDWRESIQGPPRKYYSLSAAGREAYEVLIQELRRLVRLVENSSRTSVETSGNKFPKKVSVRRQKP